MSFIINITLYILKHHLYFRTYVYIFLFTAVPVRILLWTRWSGPNITPVRKFFLWWPTLNLWTEVKGHNHQHRFNLFGLCCMWTLVIFLAFASNYFWRILAEFGLFLYRSDLEKCFVVQSKTNPHASTYMLGCKNAIKLKRGVNACNSEFPTFDTGNKKTSQMPAQLGIPSWKVEKLSLTIITLTQLLLPPTVNKISQR